jgi:hypothetical protein
MAPCRPSAATMTDHHACQTTAGNSMAEIVPYPACPKFAKWHRGRLADNADATVGIENSSTKIVEGE